MHLYTHLHTRIYIGMCTTTTKAMERILHSRMWLYGKQNDNIYEKYSDALHFCQNS